ncbi:hypothetical protein WMF18_36250 [Sorangium sp. So ce315]|uniref:hypothetical protein n=1 Tax=unclassified Sorangium TaxID=2621164 RepID=UPI003F5E3363
MAQPLLIFIGCPNRLHMIRILLGKLSRKNPLSELGERGFPGGTGARFAPAQVVDRDPDVTERAALARGSLLQQRQAEHDLPGSEQVPAEIGQHFQPRVGVVLGPTRRQAERASPRLAEAQTRGPRAPAQPD